MFNDFRFTICGGTRTSISISLFLWNICVCVVVREDRGVGPWPYNAAPMRLSVTILSPGDTGQTGHRRGQLWAGVVRAPDHLLTRPGDVAGGVSGTLVVEHAPVVWAASPISAWLCVSRPSFL